MNLLDTASLVVTPNGYKASKLYSIIPSDGTGDMTFARTGDTATRVNSSGLIETVLANKPRLDYFNSTCPKLLLEPQRTNIVLQSNDLTTTWYNANASLLSNNIISPDGTQNADKILANTTNDFHVYQQTITVSSGIVYTMSLFVKSGEYTNIELSDSSSGKGNVFNLTNKTISNPQTGGVTSATSAKIEEYSNGWLKCSITYTTASTTAFFRISISNGTTTSFSGSASSGIYVYGAQLEAGAFATSYIPTTTASVTRNNETLSLSVLPNNDMNFTAILKLANTSQGGTGGDWFQIYYPSAIEGRAYGYSTAIGFADNYNISATFTSNKNLCFKQESGINAKIFTDGVLRATSTSGTYANAFTRFQIQSENLLKPMNINSFIFYNYALTDQECITITSL